MLSYVIKGLIFNSPGNKKTVLHQEYRQETTDNNQIKKSVSCI